MIIPLTKNYHTRIDDEDAARVLTFKWYASLTADGHVYATNICKRKNIKLHRFILDAKRGEIVDHKNGDTLDNRKSNLRKVTLSENAANTKAKINKKYSTIKGVSYLISGNRAKRWTAQVQVSGKTFRLGYFPTEKSAYLAYKAKHLALFGENSYFARKEL